MLYVWLNSWQWMRVEQANFNVMVLEQVLQLFSVLVQQACTVRLLVPASIARPAPAVDSVLRMQVLQGLLQRGCMGVWGRSCAARSPALLCMLLFHLLFQPALSYQSRATAQQRSVDAAQLERKMSQGLRLTYL
jgi:hypothetical protein